jgi:hypothetical protein
MRRRLSIEYVLPVAGLPAFAFSQSNFLTQQFAVKNANFYKFCLFFVKIDRSSANIDRSNLKSAVE